MDILDPTATHTVQDVFGYDVFYLWASGFLARHGQDVYDQNALASLMYQLGWPSDEYAHAVLTPPWALWLWAILSLIPFSAARVAWPCIIAAASAIILTRIQGLLAPHHKKKSNAAALVLVLLFPWYWSNIYWGQYNFLLLLTLLGASLLLLQQRLFWAGVVLSLSLCKPNLFMGVYAYLLGATAHNKSVALIGGAIAGGSLQLLLGEALVPGITLSFLRHGTFDSGFSLPGASLSQVFRSLWGGNLSLLLPTIGCLVAFSYGLRTRFSTKNFLQVIVPLSLTIAPYMWSHSLVLLFPTYCSIAEYLTKIVRRYVYHLLLLGLALSMPFLFFAWYERWYAAVPLLALAWGHLSSRGSPHVIPDQQ